MIRVLVVDDDFMVAQLHARVVASEPGFEVAGVASSAATVRSLLEHTRPQLILLDVYLPDQSGLDLLAQIRRENGPAIDVIVISAAREGEVILKAMHGGAFHYMVKPFDVDRLRERLRDYAAHRRALGAITSASQADIDQLFRARGPREAVSPKNISADTRALVCAALDAAGPDGLSATECAQATSLSRSSTRRYLDHLVDLGLAVMRPRYGVAGRPERRYRRMDARSPTSGVDEPEVT